MRRRPVPCLTFAPRLRKPLLLLLLLLACLRAVLAQETALPAAEGVAPAAAAAAAPTAEQEAPGDGISALEAGQLAEEQALLQHSAAPSPAAEQLAAGFALQEVQLPPLDEAAGSGTAQSLPGDQACWLVPSTDLYGADLREALDNCTQPSDCCQACWDTPGCGAWTFRGSDVSCTHGTPAWARARDACFQGLGLG